MDDPVRHDTCRCGASAIKVLLHGTPMHTPIYRCRCGIFWAARYLASTGWTLGELTPEQELVAIAEWKAISRDQPRAADS